MVDNKTIKWILILIGLILIVNSLGIFNPNSLASQNIITDLNEQCNLADLNATATLECAGNVALDNIKGPYLGYMIAGVLILIIGFVGFKKR